MEETIEKLREIGVKKIGEQTHIASNKITYILNRDFDRFDRTTAIGFIRILEREYKVDMSDWVKEFEEYLSAQGKLEDTPLLENNLVDVQVVRPERSGAGRFFTGLLLLAILGGGGYYLYQNHLSDMKRFFTKEESQPSIERTLSSAHENLQSAKKLTEGVAPVEAENPPAIPPLSPSEPTVSSAPEISQSTEPAPQSAPSTPAATPTTGVVVADTGDVDAPTPLPLPAQGLVFDVEHKMWLGIIFLDKRERLTETITQRYIFDTTRPQLIVTGHGRLDVSVDGATKSYNGGSPLRFRYTPQEGLKLLSFDEFKALNGGREW